MKKIILYIIGLVLIYGIYSLKDIIQIAPMTLRLRRSEFIKQYFVDQSSEEDEIRKAIEKLQ